MPDHPLTSLAAACLHVPAPERALVVGCGDGEPALYLAREFPTARVRAVDRSPERVREATARVGLDPEGRVAFKQGGGSSLPYPDDHFDLVALLAQRASAREVARVLRRGGHLIVVEPPAAGALVRFQEFLRRLALTRHGVRPVLGEGIDDGNFFVGRLGDP